MQTVKLKKGRFFLLGILCVLLLFQSGWAQQDESQAKNFAPLEWYASNDHTTWLYSKTINVSYEEVPLEQALIELANQAAVRLSYDQNKLPDKSINFSQDHITVIEAFNKLFEDTGLDVLASPSGQIVIKEKNRTDASASAVMEVVSGQVTDANTEETLPGVNVMVIGTTIGTATDMDGGFALDVPSLQDTLRVSFVGYKTQEIPLNGRSEINILLEPDSFGMDEIIVTGVVGDTESKKLPFTVERVSSRDLEMVPSANAVGSIRGKIPGVTMVKSSGLPGSDVSVILRGATSILGRNAPMYIVDGVILAGPVSDIESLDIDNIEVIKGAAASSLYGSRAANGVINITTKRGANLPEGTPQITVRNEVGVNQLPKTPETNSSHAYLMSDNPELPWIDEDGNPTASRLGRAAGPASTTYMDNPYPVHTYDHVDKFFNPGTSYSNYVSVAQRVGQVNYVASFNNSQDAGIMRNSNGYGRQNVRLNMDAQLLDNLSVSASGYYAKSKRDNIPTTGENSPFYTMLIHAPDVDLAARDENGKYFHHPDRLITYNNPLYDVAYIDDFIKRNRTMGSGDIRYEPLEWLELSGNISYDRSDVNSERYVPIWYQQARDRDLNGGISLGENYDEAINASLTATVDREFGELATRTQVRVLQESSKYSEVNLSGEAFQVEGVRSINATDPDRQDVNSSSNEIKSEGYYLITNLDYKDKYILDIVGRRDGSSLFGADERWHNYYRASAAYRLSEEDWFNIPAVDELKFRASRGTAGGRPTFAAQYETWSVSGSTVTKNNLGNRNLKPEHATETEFGFELGLNNRILFDVTYANSVVEDQIIQLPLNSFYGFNNQWVNGGTIESNSFEASIKAYAVQKRDVNLSFTVLFDRTRSEITEFNRPAQLTSSMFYLREGEEVGTIYLPKWISNREELSTTLGGDYSEYFDKNDDGYMVPVGKGNTWNSEMWGTSVVADDGIVLGTWGLPQRYVDEDGNDLVNHGSALPDFNLSANANFRYKSFSATVLFEGQFGGQLYNDTRQRRVRENLDIMNDQRGKPEDEKKPIAYYQNDISALHGQWVEDATFIKLRELALRYSFDHSSLSPLFGDVVSHINFSIIGRNLYTWTDYSGIDPEVGDIVTRRDRFAYPNFRTISGSLEIQF